MRMHGKRTVGKSLGWCRSHNARTSQASTGRGRLGEMFPHITLLLVFTAHFMIAGQLLDSASGELCGGEVWPEPNTFED